MTKRSKDAKVQQLLDEVRELDLEKSKIMQQLRKIVFAQYPKVSERIMYGGIMFSLGEDFGGIFVRRNHISFEFGNGVAMKDPKGLLEGKGEFRRHLKLRSYSDIKEKNVAGFVKQAC